MVKKFLQKLLFLGSAIYCTGFASNCAHAVDMLMEDTKLRREYRRAAPAVKDNIHQELLRNLKLDEEGLTAKLGRATADPIARYEAERAQWESSYQQLSQRLEHFRPRPRNTYDDSAQAQWVTERYQLEEAKQNAYMQRDNCRALLAKAAQAKPSENRFGWIVSNTQRLFKDDPAALKALREMTSEERTWYMTHVHAAMLDHLAVTDVVRA